MDDQFQRFVEEECGLAGFSCELSEEDIKIRLRLGDGDRFTVYDIDPSLCRPDKRKELTDRLQECLAHFTPDEAGWPTWKCAVLTAALCAIPLLPPLLSHPISAIGAWVTLIMVYVGLVRLSGKGHVIEAAIIVLILAVLFQIVSAKILRRNDGRKIALEPMLQDSNPS